jgi:hypothetical protein
MGGEPDQVLSFVGGVDGSGGMNCDMAAESTRPSQT